MVYSNKEILKQELNMQDSCVPTLPFWLISRHPSGEGKIPICEKNMASTRKHWKNEVYKDMICVKQTLFTITWNNEDKKK